MIQFCTILITLFSFISQPTLVEGLWVTQDDETKKEKSEVLLYQKDGKLYGKIIRLLLPEDQGKLCKECKGDEKNKPIAGITIVKDLILDDNVWEGGTIMDPKSGKV